MEIIEAGIETEMRIERHGFSSIAARTMVKNLFPTSENNNCVKALSQNKRIITLHLHGA